MDGIDHVPLLEIVDNFLQRFVLVVILSGLLFASFVIHHVSEISFGVTSSASRSQTSTKQSRPLNKSTFKHRNS